MPAVRKAAGAFALAVAAGAAGFLLGADEATPTLCACVGGPRAVAAGDTLPEIPFVPTPPEVVSEMLDMADVGPGDVLYDLGSGDGRVVIEAALRGARGVGIEIDTALVEKSRARAREAGVSERADFRLADLFEADFTDATVVTLYVFEEVNLALRPRLLELAPGTRVVSHEFGMGRWRPDRSWTVVRPTGSEHGVHLWVIPAAAAGRWKLEDAPNGLTGGEIVLEQRFQEVRATLELEGRTVELPDASLAGDRLRFGVPAHGGAVGERAFEGRVRGLRLEGELRTGDGGATKLRATRSAGGSSGG